MEVESKRMEPEAMTIEGPVVKTSRTQSALFDLLSDPKSYELIFPKSETKYFEASQDRFTFGIGSMPHVTMVLKERVPSHTIVLSEEQGKVPIDLTCKIQPGENGAQAQLLLNAELNPMMVQMLEKPLNALIDALSKGLSRL